MTRFYLDLFNTEPGTEVEDKETEQPGNGADSADGAQLRAVIA